MRMRRRAPVGESGSSYSIIEILNCLFAQISQRLSQSPIDRPDRQTQQLADPRQRPALLETQLDHAGDFRIAFCNLLAQPFLLLGVGRIVALRRLPSRDRDQLALPAAFFGPEAIP